MNEDQQQNKMPEDYGQQLTGCIVQAIAIVLIFVIAAIIALA